MSLILTLTGCGDILRRAESRFTPWMDHGEYQAYFDEHKNSSYPVLVEGALLYGKSSYRAVFVPHPSWNFSYFTHHGLSQGQFEDRNEELKSSGYVLVTTQKFIDEHGAERIQATWIK